MTSLASAMKDSNCSRSSTIEISLNKLTSPGPLNSGPAKRFEKPMSVKKDGHFSCLSVSKMGEKLSGSFRYEKVELVSSQEVFIPRDRNSIKKQVADPETDTSNRMKCDARSYREWLGSRVRKDKVSGSHRKQSGNNSEACKKVKGAVVEGNLSCSKRRRVDFDSAQQCYSGNAEPGNRLHAAFPTQDGKESLTELNMDQTEERTSDVLDKESQFEILTGDGHSVCLTCMRGGKLLSCVGKGCKRKYHPSCLVPALSNYPPGFWHCIWCVEKKKELGVHSVSEVMSIWDAREVISDAKEMQSEKQYLVKYRGLAHVHNRWIPEKELQSEASTFVTEYNRRNQAIRWKSEWTIPNRFLQKRKLLFPTNSGDNDLDCTYEWLVKWTGLGYEHATWELESSSFMMSSESMKLIRDFEIRHQMSEGLSSKSEEEEKEKCSFIELSKLAFGVPSGDYDHYLSYVNKLLAHRRKNKNAVVYDNHVDQERIIKVILFVLSLQLSARRPFLIISRSTTLSVWESEFLDVASSANIIVYKGCKDVRSSIRSLEFYNENGSIMFEILLSASNVVAEDLEMLKCIRWGAIVIDECQRPGMSRYFEQIKSLRADMKLLLVSGKIKDCSADYQSMLSIFDSGHGLSSDNVMIDSNTDVCKLKERFSRYFAFECKSSSSRFAEYWVPVQLSYLQLEQYCDTVLSNSSLLSSSLKIDQVDALRELIISFRKCCDHPYLLDQSLQVIATKGLAAEENLDVGIKVSGKLQILDKILLETKARGLRVLILFQAVGCSGRDSVGNILDDFLCQRFGKYSYVRIDGGGYAISKKKAVVNLFNTKESGRQFLLLEDRACLSSIKLSAVDVVVMFNSDCKPQNDIKALHRISISSQSEQLKVFRLYSAFTVEEKFLILAKNGTSLDGNIQTLSRNSCLKLLSWCASHLLNKLDDFHDCSKSVSVSNVSCEQSFLNAVLLELLTQLPCNGESNHAAKCSFITEVPLNVVYDGNISLFGEKEIGSMNYQSSVISLIKLLEGKRPQWKLLSKSSSRNRKKVQYFDNPPTKSESEDGDVVKKSQIAVNSIDDHTYPTWKLKGKRNVTLVNKKRKLAAASDSASEKNFPCPTDGRKDVKQSNQLLLKLGISKLCEVLLLPENVRGTAVAFLEYIMQDYDVTCESVSSLQAYQISLCWTAADLLKYKLNHKESIALAKQQLNLDCGYEEVEYVYSKLQSVAKLAQCSEKIKGYKKSNCSNRVLKKPKSIVHKIIPSTLISCNQSGTVKSASSPDPDESLTEKKISSLHMKIVADQFGSDSELDCSSGQPEDHVLVSDSQQHQSPIRLIDEKSVSEPSEIPQAQYKVLGIGNDLMKTTDTAKSHERSGETEPVTSERVTVSKVGQHDNAATHLPGNLNTLEFTGTGESLVEADVNANESNSLLCQETTLSCQLPVRSSSSESNISTIPAPEVEHQLSGDQHAFSQEAVVPSHPSLEVPLDEPSGAPAMYLVEMPRQPSESRSVLENETCLENQRRSTTLLQSPNELPCQLNTVRPVTQQPSCLNPLRIELGKIQKFKEQTLKIHEDKILQLKYERDKEIEEIHKKYDMLLQNAQMAFKQKEQDFESYCRKVNSNHLLAEALMFYLNDKAVGLPDNFMGRLIDQPISMLEPPIEPSLTSLGAAPLVKMTNHQPSAVALDSSSAIHGVQSNWVGIRAAAPHLGALNLPSMLTPHHMSYSQGRMLNQRSESNGPMIPVAPGFASEPCYIHPPTAADLPGLVNSYVPPLEPSAVINNHARSDLQIS
ncbi:uncharacterized protein LOC120128894 isoform X2 [Hibiscus syriacus]|uniref:uncharacterized protein LOC120128894 isoform X2 n=1 Tax=Hibiscus syriacus TaxID=106335 RepID=UPI001923D6D1|nr:uncharacterized protein LOC120128894 isoform X2 [Hibiscus syriacus]